jgi:micrococcal nuclease
MASRPGTPWLALLWPVLVLAVVVPGYLVYERGWPVRSGSEAGMPVRLIRVVDGDSLRLRIAGYEETRFRLASVDAPERDQPFGNQASRCLKDILASGKLSATVQKTDRYGRLVGNLRVDDRRVDLQLVERGCAWWYSRYAPASLSLAKAHYGARLQKRGLWAGDSPVEPERWRRR